MVCTCNHPPKPSGWHRNTREAEKQEQDAEYPRRAGEPDCSYYVKFGSCKYGMNCMFNHPTRPSGWQGRHARASEKQEQDSEYPRRPGEPDCSHYIKFGSCKYGMDCIFNHPLHEPVVNGRRSGSNQSFSLEYEQLFPGRACKCSHHGGGKTEFEKVELNSLGLPLRRESGVCSYYMRTGICKFGTNCKFHHPDPGSEHENWEASRHAIQGCSQQNFYKVLLHEELNEQPVPLSASSPSRRRLGIIPPHETYPYPERSEYQFGGPRFETVQRVRYTRDQLLGLREAMMDSGKLCIAPLNVHLPNTMSVDMTDSTSTAPEVNLPVSTAIRSNQGSSDENYVGIVDKDVHKNSEEVVLSESSNEEPNSVKPQKNYVNEESSHMVHFGENVSRSNSSTSLSINRGGCSISDIMGLVVDAGAEEGSDEHFIATQLFIRPEYREMFLTHTPQGRLGWLKRMCQLKK